MLKNQPSRGRVMVLRNACNNLNTFLIIQTTMGREESNPTPDGFINVVDDNDHLRLVPEFMIPALHDAFAMYRNRTELNVKSSTGGVS